MFSIKYKHLIFLQGQQNKMPASSGQSGLSVGNQPNVQPAKGGKGGKK